MTDKKYSRLGSRIVLSTLNSASNSDDEDIFLSDSVADRPELRVQLRYFTVELKPSTCSIRKNHGKSNCRNVGIGSERISSVNDQKKTELGKIVSSTETTSCESFHSCRSTTSIHDVNCQGNEVDVRSKTLCGKLVSGTKIIRDDDLLNHLTMVNAIFLSKSISESTQNEHSNKNHQENAKHSRKTVTQNTPLVPPRVSNKLCSEAYTCQINHNPRVKYISKICGNNIITKPVVNTFDTLYNNLGGDRLSYTKTFSESFEPVLNFKNSGFEIVERINSYDKHDFSSAENHVSPQNLVFENKPCSNSTLSTCERVDVKVPEMRFAEIMPLCDESRVPVVFDQTRTEKVSSTDRRRRRTVLGCEESAKFCTPKSSSSVISVKSEDNFFDSTDIFHGDGDYSEYSYTESRGRRPNKLTLKNLDDTYLKMLISKSLKKIQNERENNNSRATESDESEIFESDEEFGGGNECEVNSVKETSLSSGQLSLPFKKLRLNSCFQESDQDKFGTDVNTKHSDDKSFSWDDEYYGKDNNREQGSEPVTCDSSETLANRPGNGFGKRGLGELTRTLPVIQEEGSEDSFDEDFREDNLADDYCLIDSNGRPIHLFDNEGLPLTDNSGRPLRSAQGVLLMKCDENGIPVVDHDCIIFDMFGRQPHEDRFDPSMAPKMAVCSKLSAGDGRPLLLFDAQGRPLTSVSGTMLVDSSGRGLVRLSTN